MSKYKGKTLLKVFDDEVKNQENARHDFELQILAQERTVAGSNADREAAYIALSEIYCADNGATAAQFGEISKTLQGIFDQKMSRRKELNDLIKLSGNQLGALQTQLPPLLDAETDCQLKYDATLKAVDAATSASQEFQELKKQLEALAEKKKDFEKAQARIESECAAKIRVFNSNRVFTYLLKAKCGTAEYKRTGIIASIDRWAAGVVSWTQNWSSYQVLLELPVYSKKKAASIIVQAESTEAKLHLIAHEFEVANGVIEARSKLEIAKQARSHIEEEISKAEDRSSKMAAELQSIDNGSDSFQRKAKTEMKAFLAANPISELKAKAAATPSHQDDKLVRKIEEAEETINSGRKRIKLLTKQKEEAQERQTRAITAKRKFSEEYTGTYDNFDSGVNLQSLLTGYVLGSTTGSSFWSHVDSCHHDDTPSYSSSSSSDSSSFFSSSSSSSDSSSSFSFGGGDSGGGFSSGGGD